MCEAENVNLSPGMLSSIFDLMVKTKNIKKAFTALDQLKQTYPKFTVDEHKIIDFASLLVENGKIHEAKQLLEQHAAVSKIRSGANVLKNIWQLLANVAVFSAANQKTGPTNQAKEFLEFLIKLGYCEYHNTLFGPIIREHLLKSEYKLAVEEFIEIATTKRKTPLHYELMKTLIKILNDPNPEETYNVTATEAKDLLQDVIKHTSKVHGSENTNVSVVIAFAESGTEKQLRKLLIDPSVQLNTTHLIKQCEYLSGTGAVTVLIKLAKCSRGITNSIKEEHLYEILLNQFDQNNNCTSAIELFEKIIENDEFKVTQEFARKLTNLLKRNNLEIPSTVKLYSKMV